MPTLDSFKESAAAAEMESKAGDRLLFPTGGYRAVLLARAAPLLVADDTWENLETMRQLVNPLPYPNATGTSTYLWDLRNNRVSFLRFDAAVPGGQNFPAMESMWQRGPSFNPSVKKTLYSFGPEVPIQATQWACVGEWTERLRGLTNFGYIDACWDPAMGGVNGLSIAAIGQSRLARGVEFLPPQISQADRDLANVFDLAWIRKFRSLITPTYTSFRGGIVPICCTSLTHS